jgi:hypothetical protein
MRRHLWRPNVGPVSNIPQTMDRVQFNIDMMLLQLRKVILLCGTEMVARWFTVWACRNLEGGGRGLFQDISQNSTRKSLKSSVRFFDNLADIPAGYLLIISKASALQYPSRKLMCLFWVLQNSFTSGATMEILFNIHYVNTCFIMPSIHIEEIVSPVSSSTRPPECLNSRAHGFILMKLDIRRHCRKLYGLFDFHKNQQNKSTLFSHTGAYVYYYNIMCNRRAAKSARVNSLYFSTDWTFRILFAPKFEMFIEVWVANQSFFA